MSTRDRLAELVAASGMPQTELARRLGEDRTWVNNRLRGESAIKADDLPRLAHTLGVSPAAFFDPVEAPSADSPERSALQADPALVEVLSETILRVLVELSPRYRAALWDVAEHVDAQRRAASGASEHVDFGSPMAAIVEEETRYLARAWGELPEDERRLVWKMVEAMRRPREGS